MLKYLTDIRLAVLLLVIGAASLALSLTVLDSLLLAQAAATVLLASIVYLLARLVNPGIGCEEDEDVGHTGAPSNVYRLLDIIFWGLTSAGLLLLTQGANARPLAFLLVVSGAAAVLAMQTEDFSGRHAPTAEPALQKKSGVSSRPITPLTPLVPKRKPAPAGFGTFGGLITRPIEEIVIGSLNS